MNPGDLFNLLFGGVSLLVTVCVCGSFIAIFAIIGVVLYRRMQQSSAEEKAAQSWPTTNGTILSSSLQWRGGAHGTQSQEAIVIYQYQVSGQIYQGRTVRAGEQFLTVRVPGQAQAIVSRYPASAQVTVYYNPANPSDAALEK